MKSVPPVKKQRLETGTGFLHAYQPLAVRGKAKACGVAGEIDAFAGIQQRGVLTPLVEGPELEQKTFIALVRGILLNPNLPVG